MNSQVRISGDNVEGTRDQLGLARESAAQSEKGFDELRTMMALMMAKLHNIPRHIPDPGRSMNVAFDKQESIHHDYPMPTKCSTIEFRRFSGEDLRGWVFKCEQIFEIKHTPSEAKVGLAMMHLDGKALEWHRLLMKAKFTRELPNWEEYIRAIHDRFGSLLYEDPMYELVNLRQIGNVRDYADRFELLLRNVDLRETDAVSCFLDGLKAEIALQIRMFKPKTMMEVVSLAKLQEHALMLLSNKNSNNFSISMDSVVEIHAEDLRVDTIADVSSEGDSLAMNGLVVFDDIPMRVPTENENENRVMELDNGRARIENEVVVPEEMSRKVSSGNKTVNGIKELSIKNSLTKLPSEEDVTQFQESKVLPDKFGDGLTVYGAENCMVDSQMNEEVMVILGSRASVHRQETVFVKIYSRFEMLKHATNVLSEMPRPLPEPPPRIGYSSFIQYGPIDTMRSRCSYGGAITKDRKSEEARSSLNPTLMASNVVILKLNTSHADILEIRAYGPGKMTNLYPYVISRRSTPNELQWQQLNRDFLQVIPTAYRESSNIQRTWDHGSRFSKVEEMVNLGSINRKASNEWGTSFEEPRAAPRWESQGQGIISNDGNLAMKVSPYRSPLIQKDEVEKWLQAMLSVGIRLARHSCLIIQKDLIEKWVQAMIGA